MGDTWPPFAFSESSAWGRCYSAFLRQSYERSGSTSTLLRYTQVLKHFLTSPAKMPDAYTREDVEDFLHRAGSALGREGKPVGPGTINNRLSVLKSFYSYAASYTITDESGSIHPLLQTTPPVLGMRHIQREQHYRSISFADFEKLMSVIPNTLIGLRDRALILMYFWTARRCSEICNLLWNDLYQSITVENGLERTIWMYTFASKGHARQRDHQELPMPAKKALDDYLTASGRMEHMEADDALFTAIPKHTGKQGYSRKRPLKPQSVWQIVKRYVRLAGIDNSITVHSIRHMAVQQRFLAGEDVHSLQRLLRHASLATTDIYLRGLMGTTDRAAKRLEGRFGQF